MLSSALVRERSFRRITPAFFTAWALCISGYVAAEPGFIGVYHDGLGLNHPVFERADGAVDFSWGHGSPDPRLGNDRFSVEWVGILTVPTSGDYEFITASDDGVRLWIDDEQIIDDWNNHGTTENIGRIELTRGEEVVIRLQYYEDGGGAECHLDWKPPGRARETLSSVEQPRVPGFDGDGGWLGEYYEGRNFERFVLERIDEEVSFTWNHSSPEPSMPADDFSVRWTANVRAPVAGSYQFMTASDDGVRLRVDNRLIIDDWNDHGVKENVGTIQLDRGQLFVVELEYYEHGGGAEVHLDWMVPGERRTRLRNVRQPRGFSAQYFAGENFDELVMRRRDVTIDFARSGWVIPALPVDRFSVRWCGKLPITVSGIHVFHTTSDDGVRLWIDGELLIDHWTVHGVTEDTAAIELNAGDVVDLRLDFFEHVGDAVIRLEWATPSQPRQLVRDVLPPVTLPPEGFTGFADSGLDVGGGKAAWADFDNDGLPDLHNGGKFLRNTGDGFAEVGNASPGIWGDYDNDGWIDFFSYSSRNLLRNDRGQRFVDVTGDAIPNLPMTVSVGAAWADLDGDSFLDLYVGGFENPSYQPDAILMNRRDGTFRLAWTQSGDVDPARGITACDFDEDFDVDIYVSNYRLEQNQLWRNDGSARFTNAAPSLGVEGIDDGWSFSYGHTIGSAWGDLDSDGHFDLFVGNFSHPQAHQDRPRFYRNLGPTSGYRFEDLSDRAGLAWQESFASPALADLDNDGDLDLYFTAVYNGDRNVLYLNGRDFRFSHVENSGLPRGNTYQAAWADVEGDGDLDIVTSGRLYLNIGNRNSWFALRLVGDGEKVNKSAIGAQARVTVSAGTITRQVESGTGEGNGNDLTMQFGLGVVEEETVSVEIRWPDGTVEERELRVNERHEIEYGRTATTAFLRGEVNQDGRLDLTDSIVILRWLFSGQEDPLCIAASDTNADAATDLTDAVYILAYLFQHGPAPRDPFPDCAPSELESDGMIGCSEFSCPL